VDSREEARLIDAARGGDERSFQALIAPQRASLHAHCYRLLGSLADADDALQETLLGAWKGIRGFEGRSALRSWLFTIATHACMRFASQRQHRITPPERSEPSDPHAELPAPLTDEHWLEPYPDGRLGALDDAASPEARYSERESIELAFVAALQLLPATQRAVLILRDVLGFSADEAAEALETSVASANSALQRARNTLDRRLPDGSQAKNRKEIGEEAHRRITEDFLSAWSRADVAALVALLTEDVTFTMPPLPCWFRGPEDVGTFFGSRVFALRWRFFATHANGQPAIAAYGWHAESRTYRLEVLNVLGLRGERVTAINSFLEPTAERFALLPVVS
jgi:RNA polymerase sigma-70 factor (ECF subfamily)